MSQPGVERVARKPRDESSPQTRTLTACKNSWHGNVVSLHVGVIYAPLIVLCRRLGFCYGKNRLFCLKKGIFQKNRLNMHFFRNETVLLGITIDGGCILAYM